MNNKKLSYCNCDKPRFHGDVKPLFPTTPCDYCGKLQDPKSQKVVAPSGDELREKELPNYSVEGGLCNFQGCTKICTILSGADNIWYCEEHAKQKVQNFINVVASLGGIF